MFGYEHERVCFARIGECDGGMSATISHRGIYCFHGLVPRIYYLIQKTINTNL